MIDYLNELREGCLEAYTGIVQGLKGENAVPGQPSADVKLIQPHVSFMIDFITAISQDQDRSDGCLSACAGLIG